MGALRRMMGAGLFKAFALIGALALLAYLIWTRRTGLINDSFDWNLAAYKYVARKIPYVGDEIEAVLRAVNFERYMLIGEVVAVVKLIMLAPVWTFRSCAWLVRKATAGRRS